MTDTTHWPIDLVTLADWERMGEDELHQVECSEGVLVVTPKPMPRHQVAMMTVVNALNAGLPGSVTAVPDVDVLLAESPLTVRAPDVVVTARARLAEDPPRLLAADVSLAVEIGSPGTRRIDRVTKLSEYAEAGIRDYWIVDLTRPASLLALRLDPAATTYDVVLEQVGGTVDLDAVTLDLDSL